VRYCGVHAESERSCFVLSREGVFAGNPGLDDLGRHFIRSVGEVSVHRILDFGYASQHVARSRHGDMAGQHEERKQAAFHQHNYIKIPCSPVFPHMGELAGNVSDDILFEQCSTELSMVRLQA
jgi:hypothetical protein